ncbi:MAG: AraC family transcriptional regulator, partial [Draconibacterium sp.]|nr:AraC family transcriptional regulator [Draconibacterium sp.]
LGNNNLAINYFNGSLANAELLGDKTLISSALQNIGTVYYAKGDYQRALEYMKKSEKMLKEINDKHSLMKLSQNFIEIYSQLNKPDSVIKYFQNYVSLSDSLFSEQNSKTIAEMQTKYETGKKEKELEISTIKIEEQKAKLVLLIVFIVVMLVNGVIFYLLQRRNYKKNLLLARSNLENRQLHEAEVKSRIRNNISDKAAKKILEKLAFEIETQKCYLEPELNINTLAQRTGTNREYLSQIIHKTHDKNFNEFVNYYRVQEAIEILKQIVSDGHENWTMETVAEKTGFKYTSTFNPAFKSVMNMSPTEFKKALKNL